MASYTLTLVVCCAHARTHIKHSVCVYDRLWLFHVPLRVLFVLVYSCTRRDEQHKPISQVWARHFWSRRCGFKCNWPTCDDFGACSFYFGFVAWLISHMVDPTSIPTHVQCSCLLSGPPPRPCSRFLLCLFLFPLVLPVCFLLSLLLWLCVFGCVFVFPLFFLPWSCLVCCVVGWLVGMFPQAATLSSFSWWWLRCCSPHVRSICTVGVCANYFVACIRFLHLVLTCWTWELRTSSFCCLHSMVTCTLTLVFWLRTRSHTF